MKKSAGGKKYVAKNKKANYLYSIVTRYETGIALCGTEVKSIRSGKIGLTDSYCRIIGEELFIINLNISQYENGGYVNHKPTRKRRLLMHRKEIAKLRSKLLERGYTLIPLGLYFKRGWAKLEIGLAKGKRKADKRQDIKKREAKREMKNY